MTATNEPIPRDRPNIADLIFLFVAVAVMVNASKGLLSDPGLGWHLRNIDAMRDQGGWLTEDPFTEPRDGPRAWYTNQWLGELPLYLGWKLAGLEGIAAVSAILIAAVSRYLYRIFVQDGLPWPVAVFWTALATVGMSCSWVARPNLFTLLFVLITARTVDLFHKGRLTRRATLWLLPLFAIWANTHGGFMAGFIVGALAFVAEVAIAVGSLDETKRKEARGRAIHLALLGVGLFLATLVNPYGIGLYRHVAGLLGDKYFMDLHQEWKTPDFHGDGAMRFEVLILLFPFILAVSNRRANLVELAVCLGWLHLALTGFRYVALWVLVAAPVMARASMEIPYLRELATRGKLTTEPGSPFATKMTPAPIVWSLAAALGVGIWAYASKDQTFGYQQKIIATRVVDHFLVHAREWKEKQGRRPVIFHAYDWGGYMTWKGWPEFLNWIDDRNEVQGVPRVQEYMTTLQGKSGWEDRLKDVDLICISAKAPLVDRLAEKADTWRRIPPRSDHEDDLRGVIFERIAGKPAKP